MTLTAAIVLTAATAADALQLDLDLMLRVAPVTSPTAAPARPLPTTTCSTPRSVVRLSAALPAPLPAVLLLPVAPLPAVRPLLPSHVVCLGSQPSASEPIELVLAGLPAWRAVPPVSSLHVLPVALVTSVRLVTPVPI